MLRIVDAAGGSLCTRDIVETLAPGTHGATGRRLIEGSVRGAATIGELCRLEMLQSSDLSTEKTITRRGREALTSIENPR